MNRTSRQVETSKKSRASSDEKKRRFQLRAVAHGDVGAVVWFGLASGGFRPDMHQQRLCASTAFGGQLKALQWLRGFGCGWDADTCEAAARGGHLAVLQCARANGCLELSDGDDG